MMVGDGGLSKAVDEVVQEVIAESGFKERLKKLVLEAVEKEMPAAVDRIVKDRVDELVRHGFYQRDMSELKDAIQKAIKEYAENNEEKIMALVATKAEKVMENEQVVVDACTGHLSKLLRTMAEKAVADASKKKSKR